MFKYCRNWIGSCLPCKARTESEWKAVLSLSQYRSLRLHCRDPPNALVEGEGKILSEVATSSSLSLCSILYNCAGCGTPLFSARDRVRRYEYGWPVFARTCGTTAPVTVSEALRGLHTIVVAQKHLQVKSSAAANDHWRGKRGRELILTEFASECAPQALSKESVLVDPCDLPKRIRLQKSSFEHQCTKCLCATCDGFVGLVVFGEDVTATSIRVIVNPSSLLCNLKG